MTDRNVIVRLKAEIADFKRGMSEAAKATEQVGSKAQDSTKKASSALGQMGESFRNNREQWDRLANGMIVAGGAMTAVTGAVLATGISYNTLQQTSRAALSTMLGGAEAANAQMDKLDEFARSSPFAKQVFIEAQRQLIGFGMEAEKVIPTLDAIQNAVAATGGSNQDIAELTRIIAQVGAAGKITATDLMQFGQRGVDAATLIGSQMGKTGAQIRDEITAGTLGADEAIEALTAGMQERFGGAAEGVKNTFAGAMDRVKAAIRDVASEFATVFVNPQGGGVLIDWTNKLADLLRGFQALPDPIKNTAGATFAFSGIALLAVGSTIKLATAAMDMHEAATKLNASVPSLSGSIKGLAGTIGTAAAVFAILEFDKYTKGWRIAQVDAENLAGELDGLARSTKDLGPEFANLFGKSKGALGSWALWREEVVTTDEVTSRFAANVKREFADTGFWQSMWSNAGEGTTDFREQVELLDDAFADMVNNGQAEEAAASLEALLAAVPPEHVDRVREEFKKYAEAVAESGTAAAVAGPGMSDMAAALEEQALAAEEGAAALQSLAEATLAATDANIAAMNAEIGYEQALSKANETIKENGETVNAARDALVLNTEAGQENAVALGNLASQAKVVAERNLVAGDSTAKVSAEMANARVQFIQAAEKAGLSARAAADMADEFGLTTGTVHALSQSIKEVPTSKRTNFETNAAAVQQQVRNLQSAIDRLRGKTVIIATQFSGPGAQYVGRGTIGINADGGLWDKARLGMVKAYAGGGFFDGQIGAQQPQVRPYAGPRGLLWGEEGSGPWEAFISGHPAKRDRSLRIWLDVGRRLGAIAAHADGAVQQYTSRGTIRDMAPAPSAVFGGTVPIEGRLDLGDGMTAALRGVADFTRMSPVRSRMQAGVR